VALGNEEAITAALEQCGSVIGETKRGWVHASCPLAKFRHGGGVDKHPSFGVVYNSGEAHKPEGHAHCFSCGYSGDLREIASLLYAYKELTPQDLQAVMELMEQVKTGKLPLSLTAHHADDPFPDEAWLSSFPPIGPSHTAAIEYLESRGFDRETWKHFDLRFDPQRYRVAFPLRDRAQRFRGLIGRTLIKNPEGPRYFYYPYPTMSGVAPKGFTWFNENALDLSKPVLVVEGVFDAMKAWPVYPNVTAALSISFRTPGMGWHSGVKRWVSMFDVGEGGKRARIRLEELAKPHGARVWHLPPPPGRDDPGDSTPEEILAQLQTLKS
jgi:hypothetical protein